MKYYSWKSWSYCHSRNRPRLLRIKEDFCMFISWVVFIHTAVRRIFGALFIFYVFRFNYFKIVIYLALKKRWKVIWKLLLYVLTYIFMSWICFPVSFVWNFWGATYLSCVSTFSGCAEFLNLNLNAVMITAWYRMIMSE